MRMDKCSKNKPPLARLLRPVPPAPEVAQRIRQALIVEWQKAGMDIPGSNQTTQAQQR